MEWQFYDNDTIVQTEMGWYWLEEGWWEEDESPELYGSARTGRGFKTRASAQRARDNS